MVNVLFISNNSKLSDVLSSFQPLVRIKLDVAVDFDIGLKDVFEKRPAIVFIQEQIAGVTGESVARHIQMLLGSAAPLFVLLHEGNLKLKPVKSLYDHLLDISVSDSQLQCDIQELFKFLLGGLWDKIFVPPDSEPVKITSQKSIPPQADNEAAARLVDDLLSDLDRAVSVPHADSYQFSEFSESTPTEQFQIVASPHDQLAEMLAESARGVSPAEQTVAITRHDEVVVSEFSWEPPEPAPTVHISSAARESGHSPPSEDQRKPSRNDFSNDTIADAESQVAGDLLQSAVNGKQGVAVKAAEFKIGSDQMQRLPSTNDLPPSFRITYDSTQNRNRLFFLSAAALCIIAVAALWLLNSRDLLPRTISKLALSKEKTVAISKDSDLQKRFADGRLPSFVPEAGHDSTYSSGRPGWDRYIGAAFEVRLFRTNGELKAVQIIAAQGRSIQDPLLRSVLTELTGDSSFKEVSQVSKLGFLVSQATAGRNAEILIYRKQNVIHAVVISL